MYYRGGKTRISEQIGSLIDRWRQPHQPYLEPFVGGLSVVSKIRGKRTACDINAALICMFKAIQQGWRPPIHLARDIRDAIVLKDDPDDPLTAWAAIAYSFGASWGHTYLPNYETTVEAQRTSLLKKINACKDVEFLCADYRDLKPEGCIVYCDPPYAGTVGYPRTIGKVVIQQEFDSDEFWNVMREWGKNNTVIISELAAPDDFKCIAELPHYTNQTRKVLPPDRVFCNNPAYLFDWGFQRKAPNPAKADTRLQDNTPLFVWP